MTETIERLLSFEIAGPIAQFRKYYSNISALTYEIPPRTVLSGILGSILELPRDSYYKLFSPEKSKITVQLLTGVRKYMAYTNYRNPDKGTTIQTRVELLFPDPASKNIRYRIFFSHKDQKIYNELSDRLREGCSGYGVYFGQRQFRANLGNVRKYNSKDLQWKKNFNGIITSAALVENVLELENMTGYDIISSSMPMQMQKVEDGREPTSKGETIFEAKGNGLKGSFKQVLQVADMHIAFMSQTQGA